jgi:hypothetical protein
MCMTLISVHTYKHVNATSTHRRLSGFSDGTDIYSRVTFINIIITYHISLLGRDNSGDHLLLKARYFLVNV